MSGTGEIFFNPVWDVRMTDTSLRDGSHHKRHQFTADEVRSIVAALDTAGVPVIEVTHGDGLGGSSFNYGFSKTPEQELIKLAAQTAKDAKIAFLMLPGVGTKEDIKEFGHHDRGGDQGRRGDRQGTQRSGSRSAGMSGTGEIFFNPVWDVRMTDTSLRDGSHHKRHQFTADEVRSIVAALDTAGVPVIEVTHGDGLGGSSFNYGFSKTPEQELIKLAAETAKDAKIAFLMLPGVGTKEDIKEAQNNGGEICRIATHCTEADVSIQHFGLARELGLETVGFLMMSHTISPEKLAAQARIMADAGCQCVYVVDSAGALVLDQVADRVSALVAELGDDAQVGFHGHENLGLGVANSIEAVRAGAKQIDGSCRRFGAGAGNAPVEAMIGVFDKIGVKTGIDFFEIADAAEEVVAPAMPAECQADRRVVSSVRGRCG
ncbi:4-hydroxy-2-ketovalerate aldolase [Mycolicibacterium neoaurum]|uniref:4-hydroxy-2-oxovalerate aldolase n=2 Tax=Mycolicibacterium neoaurum TaxID=1795 RepID=A0AAV2WTD8_MYCNE|nr:4-hydroxy-2-ketovalerate aldolase [Mycolicibacterium neoaurum]